MQLSLLTLALTKIYPKGQFTSSNLDLDFTSGNDTLDSRITFSRASNATVVGKDGTIQYAPHNLLTYSEQFDNAVWGKISASISSNTATAPDGTTTADKLVENTSNAQHYIAQAFTVTSGTSYTYSVYVKASGRSRVLLLGATGFTANQAIYNLSSVSTSGISNCTASIQSVGNGWYRCIWTATATSSSSSTFHVFLDNGTTTVYTGDGISGIYLWGAQLNVGALQPYYSTTVKNLLGYTQEFDNAAWTKSNSSITPNAVVAPDGSLSADKLVENIATSTHGLTVNSATINGTSYTFSVFAKKGERNLLRVGITELQKYGIFDLNTGAVQYVDTGITASITDVGNGWYRCSTIQTANITGSLSFIYRIQSSTAEWPGSGTYTGDGTSGVYVWGAQLSDSASLDPYVYNPQAAPSASAYYGPRFDYDPVTLQPKGILFEEQRTNLFQQSGNIANGAPWFYNAAPTVTANYGLSPDGTTTAARIQATGTSSGPIQSVSMAASTAYTDSVFVKDNGGSDKVLKIGVGGGVFGGGADKTLLFNISTGAFSNVDAAFGSYSAVSFGNGWWRVRYTYTTTAAAAAAIVIYGMSANADFLVWGAQREAGAFASSYIPTTSSQVTRSADVCSVNTLSPWFKTSEGSFFAEYDILGVATGKYPYVFSVAAPGNDITIYHSGVNGTAAQGSTAGVAQIFIGYSPYVMGTLRKAALAYKSNDVKLVTDSGYSGADMSVTLPTVSSLYIGCDISGGNNLNGHIRRLAYWNRRLQNAELQGITS